MKSQHIFLYTIFLFSFFLFSSCNKERVTGVSLNKNELFLSSGYSETLIATIYPENADNQKVSWKSSNSKIATVDNNGLVTAKSDGKTTITATTKDEHKTTVCNVFVDYRGKWVGDWDFVSNRSIWVSGSYSSYDTVSYSGKISYGNQNNELNVKYRETDTVLIRVDEFGKISKELQSPHLDYARGQFEETIVHIEYGRHGLGASDSRTINGIKKKGGKQ